MREIATIVADVFPAARRRSVTLGADNRSYRVNFDRISRPLPGFRCEWDAERGARQCTEVFTAIDADREEFTGRGLIRLKQLEHLIKTGQVDSDFFWTVP